MSAPFNFPREFGKMGNWPGSIDANQAQILLVQALNMKPKAKFVELGFDGGRTTIVLNWAAQQLEATIDCVSNGDNDGLLWFNRACVLHRLNREAVKLHGKLAPFACDLLAVNPEASLDQSTIKSWYAAMPSGGIVVSFGGVNDLGIPNRTVGVPGVSVYVKPGATVMDKVINHVVGELSKPKLVAVDNGAALHGGSGSAKRLRKGNGADPEVHAPVVANEGS